MLKRQTCKDLLGSDDLFVNQSLEKEGIKEKELKMVEDDNKKDDDNMEEGSNKEVGAYKLAKKKEEGSNKEENSKDNKEVEENSKAKDRKFVCSYCKNKYFARDHLISHMRTHTGEKPFEVSLLFMLLCISKPCET